MFLNSPSHLPRARARGGRGGGGGGGGGTGWLGLPQNTPSLWLRSAPKRLLGSLGVLVLEHVLVELWVGVILAELVGLHMALRGRPAEVRSVEARCSRRRRESAWWHTGMAWLHNGRAAARAHLEVHAID